MLTKTIKFDDATLGVLRAMNWLNDGTVGVITGGQLDRAMYDKVNKALAAMGGKWKRGTGHVFPTDPRPSVEGLLTSGALTIERDGFFETPENVVLKMLEIVPLPDGPCVILEPSAGAGAILKVLLGYALASNVYQVIEKNQGRFNQLNTLADGFPSTIIRVASCDFMTFSAIVAFDRVYMNPPFEEGQDGDHVRHAYDFLKPGGKLVSVMGEGIFFREDRKSKDWRIWAFSVGMQNCLLPAGSFKESGTGVNTRLVWATK